jgi:hypothetical protein
MKPGFGGDFDSITQFVACLPLLPLLTSVEEICLRILAVLEGIGQQPVIKQHFCETLSAVFVRHLTFARWAKTSKGHGHSGYCESLATGLPARES